MNGCIYQTEDERCMKFSNGKSQSWCVGKDSPCGYRIPSHADDLRSMTDEELALFIEKCTKRFIEPTKCNDNCLREDCYDCWLEWLKEGNDT